MGRGERREDGPRSEEEAEGDEDEEGHDVERGHVGSHSVALDSLDSSCSRISADAIGSYKRPPTHEAPFDSESPSLRSPEPQRTYSTAAR